MAKVHIVLEELTFTENGKLYKTTIYNKHTLKFMFVRNILHIIITEVQAQHHSLHYKSSG